MFKYFESGKRLPATFLLVELHLENMRKGSDPGKVDKIVRFCKGMHDMGFRVYNQVGQCCTVCHKSIGSVLRITSDTNLYICKQLWHGYPCMAGTSAD